MGRPRPPSGSRASPAVAVTPAGRGRWLHAALVCAMLVLCAVLAVTSLITDSITFDETAHLASGLSYLKTGDFRLSPEHPPLGKMWAAWPLLFVYNRWPAPDAKTWTDVQLFEFGREWLYSMNDGQHLMLVGRGMMVVLLLATCLTTYTIARRLWGPTAGLVALGIAALSPELLAHGRLVTTDLPVTLCFALTLLAFSGLVQRVSWPRLIAAALALTATALTKLSWPLLLPAIVAMAAIAILRRQPIEIGVATRAGGTQAATAAPRSLTRRRERLVAGLGAGVFVALFVWVGIWACYGWRLSVVAPLPAGADSPAAREQLDKTVEKLALDWHRALHRTDGTPKPGLLAAFLRLAAPTDLLPDAYMLGLALTLQYSGPRLSYLMGEFSDRGWLSYFPIAFAIKTPVATMALLAAGLAALVLRRARSRDTILLAGLLVFAVVYLAYMINGRLNIGLRHILPVYPVFYVLAGASAAWLATRVGRVLVGLALAWLLVANLLAHPHYLSYFNELVGGPSRGYLYLADSNVDWGQDLLRLRKYARQHPTESIKLSYFGSAYPTYYLPCKSLPSYFEFLPRADLVGGTYVVSVTQLLGVYDAEIRDPFWSEQRRKAYGELRRIAGSIAAPDEPEELKKRREQAATEFGQLRYKRLLNGLRHRDPDARIGQSLFLYHLTDADVAELTRP